MTEISAATPIHNQETGVSFVTLKLHLEAEIFHARSSDYADPKVKTDKQKEIKTEKHILVGFVLGSLKRFSQTRLRASLTEAVHKHLDPLGRISTSYTPPACWFSGVCVCLCVCMCVSVIFY